MIKLNKKNKLITTSIVSLALFISSYWIFTQYKPMRLQELKEVKGYKTNETKFYDLPYPPYAQSVAIDETLLSKKYTFESQKLPIEIQTFYRNILIEDKWELKQENLIEEFYTAEYRKEKNKISVWSYYDIELEKTFASVEISKKD